jgi:type I restriction enzyme R subunit
LEKGYTKQQLGDVSRMVNAGDSDLFDVLAYIAFTVPPVTRADRAETHQHLISSRYAGPQRDFVEFVLRHYIDHGVDQLDDQRLVHLIDLRYGSVIEATATLGPASGIREVFVGFQRLLYDAE